MIFLKRAIFKDNKLIIHLEVVLSVAKTFLTVAICWFLKEWVPFKLFWIMMVWIGLSLVTESLLILNTNKFFTSLSLSESEQQQYKITSTELERYLSTSPKIRLCRNLFAVLFVMVFIPSSHWNMGLIFSVVISVLVLDPFCKRMLGIKTPFIFKSYTWKTLSPLELHRHNPYYGGSDAWNATHRHRQNFRHR